ncbi:MAG: bifunctional folylpolyglutamate synthase/dihydrofolate synthase [Aquificaceae bacterium]|nr:bifunctional folylpolyglutamate synthase/dihydrofolate synthase [Aquificaceae bacterium]MDW8033122.1 folylpolyglutamate synthase/dihydrofolate synthase family protein [Aquificaceae bacterium]MDW8294134.1 folylpolyglutamate synthase/dihydrofolate synthase family protein [Aquificaceae bacterium]
MCGSSMQLYDLYRGKDYHIVPTLERIERAVDYLSLKTSYLSLQVGGTNGKGSTCAFLQNILRHHGYKVGWFVSPHLFEERERWRVNGEKISEERLSQLVKELKGIFERFELTYFEACTLIALKYFEEERVDFAVFEVGMGGRWDATKVCQPEVCIVTNIQRDHTRWLGRDCESRAVEKLGIYREGKPLVLGSMRYPLYPKALELCRQEDLLVAGIDFFASGRVEGLKTYMDFYKDDLLELQELELGLWGRYQVENASLAIKGAGLLIKLEEERLREGLKNTRWEGRMELVREKPLLLLDGAHNPDGVARVVKEVKRHIGSLTPVFTALKDKEWELSLPYLRELSDRIYLLPVRHHRGEEIKRVYEKAREYHFKEVHLLKDVAEIFRLEEDLIVLGSLYLVGELKEWLERGEKHEG